MEKKRMINIGFDIGTTSVGWSIIDDDLNIIDMGVRLFDDPANPKDGKLENAKRRDARSTRRRLKRIRTRKNAFIKLLIEKNWIESEEEIIPMINIDITKYDVQNPVELKLKALSEKVSKQELVFILFNYLHHRGFFYLTDEMLKEGFDTDIDQSILPSEKIKEFYDTNGYYKGSDETKKIHNNQYINEIRKIAAIQELDEDFLEEYLNIFKRIRDFSQGPGSEKSPTKYGLYRINEKGEVYKKANNLWDELRGKCTYEPEEYRGLKNAPVTELFNIICEINNLYFKNSSLGKNSNCYLSKETKSFIFSELSKKIAKAKTNKLSKKLICDAISKTKPEDVEFDKNLLEGYKTKQKKAKKDDSKDDVIEKEPEAIFSGIDNYTIILKWLNKYELVQDTDILNKTNLELANEIFELLAKNSQDNLKKIEDIKAKYPEKHFNSEDVKELLSVTGLTKSSSLSYKVMEEYIFECLAHLDEPINQTSFFLEYKKKNTGEANMLTSKYLKSGLLDDEVVSPTVRRAFNQSINVLNDIIKYYGKDNEIHNITIEMPRDKNTKEERESLNKLNLKNEAEIKLIAEEKGIPIEEVKKLNAAAILRLKLWKDQDYKDVYNLNHYGWEWQEVINGRTYSGDPLEVDHIIPYSISNDDSMQNKVLTLGIYNKEKGDDTPYQWLSPQGKFEKFITHVQSIRNQLKKKKLLSQVDPMENPEDFIARNLVDTRYASRVVLNIFQDFFNNNSNYPNTKIKVIRGQSTNFARYHFFTVNNVPLLPKNRDLYCHHAIDASIVCFLGMSHTIKNKISLWNLKVRERFSNVELDSESKIIFDKNTGEVINVYDKIVKDDDKEKVLNFGKRLSEYNDVFNKQEKRVDWATKPVRFSRLMLNKNNIGLMDETIYSFKFNETKTEGNLIKKLDLISSKPADLKCYFKDDEIDQSKLDKLLVYKEDKTLYKKLKTIFNRYWNTKTNPFIEFMRTEMEVENPTFIKLDNHPSTPHIKKLRVLGDSKDTENVIFLKKHNSKGAQVSFNCLSWRVYQDNKSKFKILPIDLRVLKYDNSKSSSKLTIDKEKLENRLNKLDINSEQYFEFKRGMLLIRNSDNKLFYVSGAKPTINNLELKCLSTFNDFCLDKNESFLEKYADSKKENKKIEEKRIIETINTVFNKYDFVEANSIGKLYNRKKLLDFFKN